MSIRTSRRGIVAATEVATGGGGTPDASDDFNRSNRSLNGDNGWDVRVGGVSIVSNKAKQTTHAGFDLAVRECSLSDCRIGVHVTAAGAGMDFRWTDDSNYLFSYGGTISKFEGGVLGDLLGYYAATVPGDFLEIELDGSNISLFVNGTQRGSTVTSTLNQASTMHGLATSSINAEWDDFIVTAL